VSLVELVTAGGKCQCESESACTAENRTRKLPLFSKVMTESCALCALPRQQFEEEISINFPARFTLLTSIVQGACPSSLNTRVASDWAFCAAVSPLWMVPETIPGGTPVIDEPGLNATSPLSTDGPVFVMVELATAANVTREPSDGAVAPSVETIADATKTTSQRMWGGAVCGAR
jgi:hypothetical protein